MSPPQETGGWMDGFAEAPPPPPPRHRPPTLAVPPATSFPDQAAAPTGWGPGQSRVLIAVVCCPACGSVELVRTHTKGQICFWECKTCTHRWKEPSSVGLITCKQA